MHNKRIGRDDLLKIEWARTPPSASWRFDSGREPGREERGADRGSRRGGGRSPRRGRTPSPRRSGAREYSPRKDDRRERDYERRDRGGDRSRSPEDRDREMKDVEGDRENGANGEDRKVSMDSNPAHDELDTAE